MNICRLVISRHTFAKTISSSLWITLLSVIPTCSAPAQVPDTNRWQQLSAANNLTNEGSTPFHLKLEFQLYDLAGKPAETGTIEEWWQSSKVERTIIQSPSYNYDSAAHSQGSADERESFLVDQLLQLAINPVPRYEFTQGQTVEQKSKDFAKTSFDCFNVKTNEKATTVRDTVCTAPKTDIVRVATQDGDHLALLRNSLGSFHDHFVALAMGIDFDGKIMISGKVVALQAMESNKPATQPPPTASTPSGHQDTPDADAPAGAINANLPVQIPGGVIAGKRVSFVQPTYPDHAKALHLSGTVLLRAIIGKDGSIKNLVTIASTDSIFTPTTAAAVRQWKYAPYLLNGVPTEVDTTITVNFQLNSGSTSTILYDRH
jgi:TonB family protein